METVNDKKMREHFIKTRGIDAYFGGELPNFLLFKYRPEELLTAPFSPNLYLQFIVEGDLLLYDMPDENSTILIQTTHNNVNLIGEVELLDSLFTPFFVEAKTDVYTLAVYVEQYRQQLLNDPVFLRYLCTCLANKLNGAVISSRKTPLRQQISLYLQRSRSGDTLSGISQLARSFDVSTRQLLRVLKELCEEGILVHVGKGLYKII